VHESEATVTRQLIDGTTEPAIAIAADGRILGINEPAERYLGAPAEAVLGRYCGDVVRAVGRDGQSACRASGCETLEAFVAGRAETIDWCGRIHADGRQCAMSGTLIATPPDARDDGTVGLIILHDQSLNGLPAAPYRREGLRLRFLGAPVITLDGAPVRLARRRVLEVLAMLALAGPDGLHRDRICDLLWPNAPAGRGRGHLRVLMHSLRQALGDGIVVPHPSLDTLRLHPGVWVDLREFEAGASAILNATGPLNARATCDAIDELISLYGGDLGECSAFGTWSVPARERLRGLHVALLARAVPLAPLAGDACAAIDYCRQALTMEPLLEEFQVALIQLYGELGRHQEALAQYQAYRRLLASETGALPSPAFERAIRRAMATREAATS
jgi:DNA-binding SARP family transcriptional activator